MADHSPIDKKTLSERDICTKFITPAIKDVAGWNITQFYEEFTLGKIHVRGKRVARGVRDRADYILFHTKNHPLAIIEAKDNHHDMGAGMQQALCYADMLDIPFAYSTNGDGFIEHDRTRAGGKLERVLGMNEFPSPDQLWERYKAWKQIRPEEETIINQPYYIGEKPLHPIKEVEEPFELPNGWDWYCLKEITIYLQTGPFGSSLHKSDYGSDGIPVVNPVEMRNKLRLAKALEQVSESLREYVDKTL